MYDELLSGFQKLERTLDTVLAELSSLCDTLGIDPATIQDEKQRKNSSRMTNISSEAKELLQKSTITATSVTLPAGNLGKLYTEIKKVLEAAGGKWNTKAACFLFARDPREQLSAALSSGKVVSTKKDTQAFYTPRTVVNRVLGHLPEQFGMQILEPSAGSGAFADVLWALGHQVDCIELDPESVKILHEKGFTVREGDFLTISPDPVADYYDAVVMNPPFTKGQDMRHVSHAFEFLKPGGTLLSVMSPAFQSHSSKQAAAFRELVDAHGEVVEEFEAGAFKESGTNVRTVLLKLVA